MVADEYNVGSGLMMMHMMKSLMLAVKKEMNEKGLTFDEFLGYYDEILTRLECEGKKDPHHG